MDKDKHIFYVQSDFHYMICKSIIVARQLDVDQCYFICRRGLTVEKGLKTCLFLGGKYESFFYRFRFLLSHYGDIKNWIGKSSFILYLPFRYKYPSYMYVKEVVFFEEGFSAYKTVVPNNKYNRLKKCLINSIKKVASSFFTKNIQGFLMLTDQSEINPQFNTLLYVCTPIAYKTISSSLVKKELLPISCKSTFNYNLSPNTFFIVLERFSEAGRTCSLDGYKSCVKKMFEYCVNHEIHEVWTKFHPADWSNPDAIDHLNDCNAEYNLNIHFFDGRLEFLALQNIGIVFLSTSSTILYYAPILGVNNKSVSFCKYLASIDERYSCFMESFGGIDKFVDVFSENVDCLDLIGENELYRREIRSSIS